MPTGGAAVPDGGGHTARIMKELKQLGVGKGAGNIWEALGDLKKGLVEKLKILLTYFQVTTAIKANLNVTWPWKDIPLWDTLGVYVNINMMSLASMSKEDGLDC